MCIVMMFRDRLLDAEQRDAFGIVVSYSVKVKLYLGALSGELVAELPFILMHPKVPTLHPRTPALLNSTIEHL